MLQWPPDYFFTKNQEDENGEFFKRLSRDDLIHLLYYFKNPP